jgi:hypothetical protein
MNIVKLIIGLILALSVLYFLLPWVSKKIEEPFQGSNTCVPTTDTQVLGAAPIPSEVEADDYANKVKYGRQVFNSLGFLQPLTGRAFSDQLSDQIAPGQTESPLDTLNKKIASAFQTVELIPTRSSGPTVAPDVSLVYQYNSAVGSPVVAGYLVDNNAAVERSTSTNFKAVPGYVEEQLPPNDPLLGEAAKCENVSLDTTVDATGTVGNRPRKLARLDICDVLGTDSTELGAKCGVCVKGGEPLTVKTRPFVGGMYISTADAARGNTVPTAGTCPEGHFFRRGQKAACQAKLKSIICEEYGDKGGFTDASLTNPDNNCVACITPTNTVNYIYNNAQLPETSVTVRVRIVVPSGTGRNIIRVRYPTETNRVDTYYISPITVGETNMVNNVSTSATTNCIYFTASVDPKKTLQFEVVQEYPHRSSRGLSEVFLVSLPRLTAFARSIGCEIATYSQLSAIANQPNVCGVGYAKKADNTIGRYTSNTTSFGTTCSVIPEGQSGVVEVTGDVSNDTGIWCYGIKPPRDYLNPASMDGSTVINPEISNFRTSSSGSAADSTFSQYGLENTAAYRGIIIQLEEVLDDTASTTRAVSAEKFMTKVGQSDDQTLNAIISETETDVSVLDKYTRNGLFENSARITKPSSTGTSAISSVLSSNYWIWGKDQQTAYFTFTVRIPGYFKTPVSTTDAAKCTTGPLYADIDMFNRVLFDACTKQVGPTEGSLSDDCIKVVFKSQGNIDLGTLSPTRVGTGATNMKKLRYTDPELETGPRSKVQLIEYLSKLRSIALLDAGSAAIFTSMGLTTNDSDRKLALSNEASMSLFGKKAANPCEKLGTLDAETGVYKIALKTGTLDARCLDYLYKKTGQDDTATATILRDSATYSNIGDNYSFTAANQKQACQPNGTWAPIGPNGEVSTNAVSEINAEIANLTTPNMTEVEKAISIFNKVYTDANNPAATDIDAQAVAIQRCYGIVKKKYTTNCEGVLASKVRIVANSLFGASSSTVPQAITGWQILDASGANILTTGLAAGYSAITPIVNFSTNMTIVGVKAVMPSNASAGSNYEGLIVQLLDGSTANRVIVQKTLTAQNALEFNTEDIRPLVPYKNLQNLNGVLQGLRKQFRFESALYPQKYLTHAGGLGDYSDSSTIFQLGFNKDNLSTANSPIYSLYEPGTGSDTNKKYLCRNEDRIQMGSSNFYASWAILPATNGSPIHINIQSANQTSQFLVPKMNGTDIRVDVMMPESCPPEKFEASACWRLIPASSSSSDSAAPAPAPSS